MATRDTSISVHYWRCGQGHQNSTEVTAEERRQSAILLKCWVAGCTEQKAISGRISSSQIRNELPQRGALWRFLTRS